MEKLPTRPSRFKSVKLTAVVACVLLLSLVGAGPAPAGDHLPEGETNGLVICIPVWPGMLDPTDYRSRVAQIVLKNIFDSLTARDGQMKVVPQLAESWRAVSATRWEFRLRPGVKFHNGAELTAEDVKFTLDLVSREGALNGRASPGRGLFKPISRVAVGDARTVIVETTKPWPILPLMLSLQGIIPRRYMIEVGPKAFRKHPIGCGPFEFVRAEGEERLVLKRFAGYYGDSPAIPPVQPARLKYLVFRTVRSSAERIGLLKKGEVDIIGNVPPEADWDFYVSGWGNSTLDPVGIPPPKLASRGRANYSGYSNPEVDRLLALAEGAIDRQVRQTGCQALQRTVYHDAPMIFCCAADEIYGVRERVGNFKPTAAGMIVMHDIYLK